MDDDSEFQSQSFQLLGEDGNKFPPSFRSFALPKIDIDEHLQVHLRFDSLVDTEALLGIQGQDNSWIEDFSSGTTAIEFSSSAAESCSISRHNNVWSEATSSESVEMLLKSVAEEEMTGKQTSIMEKDELSELRGTKDQMDTSFRQDDDHKSGVGDIGQNLSALPLDKCVENLSMVDEGATIVQPQVEGAVARQTSDSIICTSTQDDPSSAFNNPDLGPRKFNIQTLTDNVVEEHIEISMSKRSDLLSNDGQKETSHVTGRDEVTEQYLEVPEAMRCLSTGKRSLVEPNMDSMMLMGEGCNRSGYSENSDGLLEAIAYPIKALSKEIEASDRSSTQSVGVSKLSNNMCSLTKEEDKSMETQSVEIGSKNLPILPPASEDSKVVCYKQQSYCSNVDYFHVELPTQNAKINDDHGGKRPDSPTEVTKGKQYLECNPTENSSNDIGNTSEMTLEVHASVHTNSGTHMNKVEDEVCSEAYISRLKSQNPESMVIEKSTEVKVAEKPEVEFCSSDVKSNEFHSSTYISVAGVRITSPIPKNMVGQEDLLPSTLPGITDTNNNDIVSIDKAEDTSTGWQNTDTLSVIADTSTSVKDLTQDAMVTGHTLADADPTALKKHTIMQQSHTDTSSVVDGILEHKGEDSNVQLQSGPVTVTDSLVANESPLQGEIQVESGVKFASLDHQSADASALEQKEEAISSSPASELVHSRENEITIPGIVSVPHPEGKKFTQVSSEPVPEPAIGYRDSTTEPRPIMDGKSSSYMDTSVRSPCQIEPHPSADKPPSHESTNWVEGVLVVNDSALNGKDTSDFPAIISQENKEKAQSSDGAETCFIDSSTFNLSKSNAESHLLEAGSGKLSSLELNCGSPTIISCSEHPQDQEGSRVLSEQAATISNDVPFISSGTEVNDDEIRLSVHEVKESTALEDDKGFTFEVGSLTDLSEKNTGNEWKPFPSMQSPELPKMSKEKPHGRRTESKERKQGLRRKTPNTDKTSKVAVSNESPSKPQGKPSKEKPILKTPIDRDSSSCSVSSTYSATVNKDMQLEESRQHTCIEKSKMKTSCSPIVQTSSLPDLNSSVVATTLFSQPFTDLQQVQLRAQIFVYGSLIQGIPPDEACMVSAFAETDGGRSSWEGMWRLFVERYQAPKSPFINSESPHPHSAIRVPEQVTWCNSLLSKIFNTPTSQTNGKVVPPAIQNSTPPLPSPVWSISTHDGLNTNMPRGMHLDFNQPLSPLHSYYSSQTKQFANSSMLWPSQVPRIGPRGVSVQGLTLAAATQYSTVPVVETVQVASMRDSTTPSAPNIQLVTPGDLLPTPSPVSVTAPSVVQIETQGKTTSPGANKNASTIQKPRKRKKAGEPKELGSTIPVSQCTTEPSATIVTKTATPASAGLVASSGTKVACATLLSTSTDIFPAHCQVIGSNSTEQRAIFSEETCSRIEQAKMQAEEAAVLAAASVRHSQSIWSQLAAQKDSGLVSEVEVKLASAAVAAAAAASVAKAAAAAAKIASDVAVQAKMMADEALNLARTGTLTQSPDSGFDVGKNMARVTPDSILKGKDKVERSTSVISAAREAARRRVEAASAATKRAENIDAILKAAELAAEAVSQAGFIIAMGDPLPFKLSELVESGPEGFWKAKHSVSENTNDFPVSKDMGLNHNEHHNELVRQSNVQPLNKKDIQQTAIEGRLSKNEQSVTLAGNYQEGGLGNAVSVQNNRQQRENLSSNLKESDIQKGSFVEVVTDDDGLRGAWYSACVLDVKDKKVYVCYDNLLNDKGSGQLKEWVPLESEGNIAPRIRIAHPMTVLKHEVTKKRRREAVGNNVWEVGDRVDAWMRDGWWEGIVTEKTPGDETKLTLHFPAGGDSSVVRAWNLRPSLIWKDDQWVEWSRARDNTLQPYEGDTPQEKRQKLNRAEAHLDAEVDSRGIAKLSRETPLEDSRKPEESRPLNLSAKDNFFSVGRNAREEGVSDANKVRRTGLQKEGSRVVFGVPKPGKKRKFMEVSKHYVSDGKTDKTTEMKDSLKFAKYLMPQQSHLWKNSSKVDPKGKNAGESNKLRGLKTLKSQTIQTRSTTEKDTSSISTTSVSIGEDKGRSALPNSRDGIGNKCNLEKNNMEVLSFPSSLGTTSSLPDSYVQSLPRGPAAKKKVASAAQAESKIKGRSTTKVDKPNRSEDEGFENSVKALPDSIEPRRSIRRIQPTSRLLEGLQSSLIISKIPSFSHDKGARSRGSSSSSRGNTRG